MRNVLLAAAAVAKLSQVKFSFPFIPPHTRMANIIDSSAHINVFLSFSFFFGFIILNYALLHFRILKSVGAPWELWTLRIHRMNNDNNEERPRLSRWKMWSLFASENNTKTISYISAPSRRAKERKKKSLNSAECEESGKSARKIYGAILIGLYFSTLKMLSSLRRLHSTHNYLRSFMYELAFLPLLPS